MATIEHEDKIKISFEYVDEFGQLSQSTKTMNTCVLDDFSALELLLNEFKNFMLGSGFSATEVEKIQFNEGDL